jgi:hypothetical protein
VKSVRFEVGGLRLELILGEQVRNRRSEARCSGGLSTTKAIGVFRECGADGRAKEADKELSASTG